MKLASFRVKATGAATVGVVVKSGILDLHAGLGRRESRARMVLQVHDELVCEFEEGFVDTLVEQAKQRMQAAADLRVPLLVEAGVGDNWDEAH